MSDKISGDTGIPSGEMEEFKWLGEHAPGGFFIYRADEGQEILYVNAEMIRFLGCDTERQFRDYVGNSFRGIVHPDDLEDVEASIEAQIADEANKNYDSVVYRVITADGRIRWADDYGQRVHVEGMGDVYYVFIGDITDSHRIAEENARRASVIGGLSVDYEMIALYDLDTSAITICRVEQTDFSMSDEETDEAFGLADGWNEVVARYAESYIIKEDRKRYLDEMRPETIKEKLQNTRSYYIDYRCSGINGEIEYYRVSIAAVGENPVRQAVIGHCNVTDQVVKAQNEIADKMRVEMELERERRTNDLRSDFLFNISHDLRTPMNAIIGFTDLAKRHADDHDALLGYLDMVESSNCEMLKLIDDLLEMNSINYGGLELKYEPIILREQIVTVLDLLRPETETKGIGIETRFELPEKPVMADAHRVRRIAAGIIGNAVKFTPDGGRVYVSLCEKEVSASGYGRFELIVRDTGVGMSEEFMKRMFEAFERERSSTESGKQGTGLGLTIVKKLLDAMGGSIEVKSQKDVGTEVTINLPLKYSDRGETESKKKVSASGEAIAEGNYRILLVEDIEINRLLAETILREAGFEVESVPDGCDAVEAVKNNPQYYYDLVLMDIQMPVMNGYEATRAIRAIDRGDVSILPIIALSANARTEDREMSLESGMNKHIAKPFDAAELVRTVNDEIAAAGRKR
ncbi:MAG: response regulator [Clostridia bacterium]|nr:response regulator [Clostridia bacterium]